jgi:hypothetical protein
MIQLSGIVPVASLHDPQSSPVIRLTENYVAWGKGKINVALHDETWFCRCSLK